MNVKGRRSRSLRIIECAVLAVTAVSALALAAHVLAVDFPRLAETHCADPHLKASLTWALISYGVVLIFWSVTTTCATIGAVAVARRGVSGDTTGYRNAEQQPPADA